MDKLKIPNILVACIIFIATFMNMTYLKFDDWSSIIEQDLWEVCIKENTKQLQTDVLSSSIDSLVSSDVEQSAIIIEDSETDLNFINYITFISDDAMGTYSVEVEESAPYGIPMREDRTDAFGVDRYLYGDRYSTSVRVTSGYCARYKSYMEIKFQLLDRLENDSMYNTYKWLNGDKSVNPVKDSYNAKLVHLGKFTGIGGVQNKDVQYDCILYGDRYFIFYDDSMISINVVTGAPNVMRDEWINDMFKVTAIYIGSDCICLKDVLEAYDEEDT